MFGLHLKSNHQTQGHLNFLLSFRSCIVLCFTFKSMIHFQLIFVAGVKKEIYVNSFFFFFFLHMEVQLFQYHLSKGLSFVHCIAFALFFRIYVSFFSGLFCFIDLYFYSFTDNTLS